MELALAHSSLKLGLAHTQLSVTAYSRLPVAVGRGREHSRPNRSRGELESSKPCEWMPTEKARTSSTQVRYLHRAFARLTGFQRLQLAVETLAAGKGSQRPASRSFLPPASLRRIPTFCWGCERFSSVTLGTSVTHWRFIIGKVSGTAKFRSG